MPSLTHDVGLAAARLRAGGLVAIPTETVYGLAADARNPEAIEAVYALKGRPASNPLIVHVGQADWLAEWAAAVPSEARDLVSAFWPGPLTLVLAAHVDVPRTLTAGQDTVALRQPDHPLTLELLAELGRAVVAPSANRFMSVSPTEPEHVARQFPDSDLMILDGGPCRVGVESTIVSLLPEEPPRLLRPGMISAESIERVLQRKLLQTGTDTDIRVPGQHDRHYAPGAPAWRFGTAGDVARDARVRADRRLGWLLCGSALPVAGPMLDLGSDPNAYARRFYAALYRLDHADLDGILIEMPPQRSEWLALRDRVIRATRPWTEAGT